MKLVLMITASLFLFGCTSGAKQESMIYAPAKAMNYDEALKKSVHVTTTRGGETTNPVWTSEISNDAFSEAVKETLLRQGLLSNNGKYKLEIILIKVEQPLFGIDFEVTTHIKYTLTDSSDSSIILNETVVASYTATFADAFVGSKRLRLANEGSGKENIKGLLQKLSELKVDPNQVSIIH